MATKSPLWLEKNVATNVEEYFYPTSDLGKDFESLVPSTNRKFWILQTGQSAKLEKTRKVFALHEVDPSRAVPDGKNWKVPTRRVIYKYGLDVLEQRPREPNVEAGIYINDKMFLFEKLGGRKEGVVPGNPRIFVVPTQSSKAIAHTVSEIPNWNYGPITDAALTNEGHVYLLTERLILQCLGCLEGQTPSIRVIHTFTSEAQREALTLDDRNFIVGDETGLFQKNPAATLIRRR